MTEMVEDVDATSSSAENGVSFMVKFLLGFLHNCLEKLYKVNIVVD